MTAVHPAFGMRTTRFGNGVAQGPITSPSQQASPAPTALAMPQTQFGNNADSVHFGMRGRRVVATSALFLALAGVVGTSTGCSSNSAEAVTPQTSQSQSATTSEETAKNICQSSDAADIDVVAKALSYLSPDLATSIDTAGIKATGEQKGNAPAGVAAELVKRYTANLEEYSKGISDAFGANIFIKIVNEDPAGAQGTLPDWLQSAVKQQNQLAGKAPFGANKRFWGPGQFAALQSALGSDYVKITNDPMASLVGRALKAELTC